MSTSTVFLFSIVIAVTAAAPGDRKLTIINQCQEVVRVGRTGGECNAPDFSRFNVTGCPPGQTLDSMRVPPACFWDIPPPEDGKSLDIPSGKSINLILSAPEQTCINAAGVRQNQKWSGGIWGATGCNISMSCETGICLNGSCPTFTGPAGPLTIAEFTLKNDATDFYDITVIGGANLPMEMKPSAEDFPSASQANMSGVSTYYWCGNPGGITAMNSNLAGCTWTFNPTNITGYGDGSIYLRLVANSTDPTAPNAVCTRDNDCTVDGEICGTLQQLNSESGGPMNGLFPGRCGRFIGLWSADAICTWAAAVSGSSTFPNTAPFNCRSSTGQGSGQLRNLYECSAPYTISGYSTQNNVDSANVCGCPLWENLGITAPATLDCQHNNSVWHQRALPWVEWIKRACPTSYVFPFDDKSSTFQCQNQVGPDNTNGLGYTITFCPGGGQLSLSSAVSGVSNSGIIAVMIAMALIGTASM